MSAPRPDLAVIDAAIRAHVGKSLLRFNTCGSVDDGKSTLIGRLLYESKALFDDQLAALEADSKRVGTRPGELDYALLLDGLAAEREQGITIDVAYRYFATALRKFIIADAPGHDQYTRNMTARGPRPMLIEFAGVGHAPMLLSTEQIAPVVRFLQD